MKEHIDIFNENCNRAGERSYNTEGIEGIDERGHDNFNGDVTRIYYKDAADLQGYLYRKMIKTYQVRFNETIINAIDQIS